jgi:hypothetical protein
MAQCHAVTWSAPAARTSSQKQTGAGLQAGPACGHECIGTAARVGFARLSAWSASNVLLHLHLQTILTYQAKAKVQRTDFRTASRTAKGVESCGLGRRRSAKTGQNSHIMEPGGAVPQIRNQQVVGSSPTAGSTILQKEIRSFSVARLPPAGELMPY